MAEVSEAMEGAREVAMEVTTMAEVTEEATAAMVVTTAAMVEEVTTVAMAEVTTMAGVVTIQPMGT